MKIIPLNLLCYHNDYCQHFYFFKLKILLVTKVLILFCIIQEFRRNNFNIKCKNIYLLCYTKIIVLYLAIYIIVSLGCLDDWLTPPSCVVCVNCYQYPFWLLYSMIVACIIKRQWQLIILHSKNFFKYILILRKI